MRPLITAEHVHGKTGLDGPDLPEPAMPLQTQHAVDFIIETLRNEEAGSVTLCALGPLTNIAHVLIRAPELASRIREIVLMGGGFFEGGNITPTAEFNIYVDPQAAQIVLQSGVPVAILPLDVTHKALTTARRVDRFRAMGTRSGDACVALLEFFERFDEEKYGRDGGPLHDPNVIAYLLKPELYGGRRCNVMVDATNELTLGMTVVDWWGVTDRPSNAFYIRDVNDEEFFDLLIERISRLP